MAVVSQGMADCPQGDNNPNFTPFDFRAYLPFKQGQVFDCEGFDGARR